MNQLYLTMRQDIIEGRLQVGEQLIETTLAQRYEVSRTPVREAMRRLEQDGLVERSPRGGMRVKVWTADEMFDLYELRIILESGAARWAAERKTRLDLIRLRQTNEEMRKLDPAVADNLRDANLAFHEALWRASHNAPLIDTLGRLQRQIMRHPASTLQHPGRWAAIIKEHDRLIEAIERGDDERAATIAGEHMIQARDLRLANYLADQEALNQA